MDQHTYSEDHTNAFPLYLAGAAPHGRGGAGDDGSADGGLRHAGRPRLERVHTLHAKPDPQIPGGAPADAIAGAVFACPSSLEDETLAPCQLRSEAWRRSTEYVCSATGTFESSLSLICCSPNMFWKGAIYFAAVSNNTCPNLDTSPDINLNPIPPCITHVDAVGAPAGRGGAHSRPPPSRLDSAASVPASISPPVMASDQRISQRTERDRSGR